MDSTMHADIPFWEHWLIHNKIYSLTRIYWFLVFLMLKKIFWYRGKRDRDYCILLSVIILYFHKLIHIFCFLQNLWTYVAAACFNFPISSHFLESNLILLKVMWCLNNLNILMRPKKNFSKKIKYTIYISKIYTLILF